MPRFEEPAGPKKAASKVKQARSQIRGLRNRLHDRIIGEQGRLSPPSSSSNTLFTSPTSAHRSSTMPSSTSLPSDGDGDDDTASSSPLNVDGSGEKRSLWGRSSTPVGAIFVHAGAGYHSTTNEHIHLGACAE